MFLYPSEGDKESDFDMVSPFWDWQPYTPLRDLHDMLLHEYHSLNGIGFPYHTFYDAPEEVAHIASMRAVLPEYNGWWWNPKWDMIVRLQVGLRQRKHFPGYLPAWYINEPYKRPDASESERANYEIDEVVYAVIQRAQLFALTNYAEPLFTSAIFEAEKDVKQAYRSLNNFIYSSAENNYNEGCDTFPSDYLPTEDEQRGWEDGFPMQERLYRQIRYQNLRLYWLHLAQTHVQQLIRSSRKSTRTRINFFDRLIKPSEISKVANCFENRSLPETERVLTENEYVGWWYATMLYSCGATWRELRAIVRPYKSWSALVSKRMDNSTDHKDRTSRHTSGIVVRKRRKK